MLPEIKLWDKLYNFAYILRVMLTCAIITHVKQSKNKNILLIPVYSIN